MSVINSDKPIHPAAELFPLMDDEALQKLADDIVAHGQHDPISLYEGKVLDGRNRQNACRIANVEPRYEVIELKGASPTLFVVSRNLYRRHLNEAQLATVAADMVPMLAKEAKERLHQGQIHGGHTAGQGRPKNSSPASVPETYSSNETKGFHGETRHIAGVATGVSARTVQSAIYVKKNDPELFGQMREGKIPARTAERQARERAAKSNPPKKQQGNATPRQQAVAKATYRRMSHAAASLEGLGDGLSELNVSMAVAAAPPGEPKAWIKAFGKVTGQLHMVVRKVRAEI
jgi:hypothetical protein